jgi:hypothetical protein
MGTSDCKIIGSNPAEEHGNPKKSLIEKNKK